MNTQRKRVIRSSTAEVRYVRMKLKKSRDHKVPLETRQKIIDIPERLKFLNDTQRHAVLATVSGGEAAHEPNHLCLDVRYENTHFRNAEDYR